MADNRLKKSPDVTGEEFLAEIYGSKSRPEWRALTTLFGKILTGRSTLVGDLSLPLREGPGASGRKRVQECVLGWRRETCGGTETRSGRTGGARSEAPHGRPEPGCGKRV